MNQHLTMYTTAQERDYQLINRSIDFLRVLSSKAYPAAVSNKYCDLTQLSVLLQDLIYFKKRIKESKGRFDVTLIQSFYRSFHYAVDYYIMFQDVISNEDIETLKGFFIEFSLWYYDIVEGKTEY